MCSNIVDSQLKRMTMGVLNNFYCKYCQVQLEVIIIQEFFLYELLETLETYLQIVGASWNPSQRPGNLLKLKVSFHSLTFSYLGLKLVEYETDEPKN